MPTVFKYHKPHSIPFHTPCYEVKNIVSAMLTITIPANMQRTDRFDVHFFPLFSQNYPHTHLQESGFTLHTFIVTNVCAQNCATCH